MKKTFLTLTLTLGLAAESQAGLLDDYFDQNNLDIPFTEEGCGKAVALYAISKNGLMSVDHEAQKQHAKYLKRLEAFIYKCREAGLLSY